MKTIAEAAIELGISTVTINKYKNKTLRDQLEPHFFKEFRRNAEVSVIDADGIEIIRKWKESINADADSTSEDTASSTEPLKGADSDFAISDNKLFQITLSSLNQQISALQHTISSLEQQITVKDKQIDKMNEQASKLNEELSIASEALRLQSDRNDTHFETQQKMMIALMASPKLKIDTAYFSFSPEHNAHIAEDAAQLADGQVKTSWRDKFKRKKG